MVINRTEGSSIRSVFIRVINKIGRPRSGSPICVITSMITDRIGRREDLLPNNKTVTISEETNAFSLVKEHLNIKCPKLWEKSLAETLSKCFKFLHLGKSPV